MIRVRILNSVSGGKTSMEMTHELMKEQKFINSSRVFELEIKNIFMNTGREQEETLRFLNENNKQYKLNLIWLEAVVDPRPYKGTKHKIINFESACRDDSIFESVIAKYGIPSIKYLHCTREMKEVVARSFARSIGWEKNSYYTCLGIRSDEMDRVSENYEKLKLAYPLLDLNIDKREVNRRHDERQIKLNLKDYQGNCKGCHKKSFNKLRQEYLDDPTVFNFHKEMEKKYGLKRGQKGNFFRGNITTEELILKISKNTFTKEELDQSNGCSESCEPFQ